MPLNKELIKKNQIVIILVLIIVTMSVVKIKYGYKSDNSQQMTVGREEIKISPTVSKVPTVDPKKDYPLKDKLPYYGKGYVVEKYTSPLTLKMILNGATETNASRDVTVWINSFGDAIGQHKIEVYEEIK